MKKNGMNKYGITIQTIVWRKAVGIFSLLILPLLLHGTFDALLFIVGGGVVFGIILFIVFIVFDIKMWKWGLKRIRILQQFSQQQNFNRNNPFEGFKWEI